MMLLDRIAAAFVGAAASAEELAHAMGRAGNVLGRMRRATRARLAGGLHSVDAFLNLLWMGGPVHLPSDREIRAAMGAPFRRRALERRKARQRGQA